MKFLKIILLLVLPAFLGGCISLAADIQPPAGADEPVRSSPVEKNALLAYPQQAPNPGLGGALYNEYCLDCHGLQGMGDGVMAAEFSEPVPPIGSIDMAREATPVQWYSMITQGRMAKNMPPYANTLTDQQRWDVTAYLFSLSATQEEVDQGKMIYQAQCARCHGGTGQGDGPEAASLPGKPANFLDYQRMATRSSADLSRVISQGGAGMPAFAGQLSETERRSVAVYVQALGLSYSGDTIPATAWETTPASAATQAITNTVGITATPAITTTTAISGTIVGTVSGLVTNGSGGALPPDLTVTLRGFEQGEIHVQNVITQTVAVQEGGKYLFSRVDLPTGRIFMATVDYQGATYASKVTTVNAGDHALDMPIELFDTTTDASGLVVDRLHLFVEPIDNNLLRLVEVFIISNPGKFTVAPSQAGAPNVAFTLPVGASNLQFQDGALGERYLKTEDGFADTQPVNPGFGAYQVVFAFDMPYSGKLELTQPLNLPVTALVVLTPDTAFKINGANLSDEGISTMQARNIHLYSAASLPAGAVFQITIADPSFFQQLTSKTNTFSSLAIGVGALGLVFIVVGWILYRRNRRTSRPAYRPAAVNGNGLPVAPTEDTPDALMDAILALDDLHKAGKLSAESYQKRRVELKSRLKNLLDQAHGA